MYRTRVGYTGGDKKDPTYHSLGNHTEALQVDFDPQQISFAKVTEQFWADHNPLRESLCGRQYMSAIWYHNNDQRQILEEQVSQIETRRGATVETHVLPLSVFYVAEDYHQKYLLQNSPLQKHFDAMFSEFSDFNNSTAAARLNGFVAGNGTSKMFDRESAQYGIATSELRQFVRLS